MDFVGFTLPSTSLQVEPRTVWLCLLLGTVVTVVAALVPARRATRVLPVEALRDSTPGAERPSWRRVRHRVRHPRRRGRRHAGLAVRRCGVHGVRDRTGAALVGVIVALPLVVRPLAAVIATPLRWRGLPGELAKQNATRNPRRTSSTAAALMIGLTLVVSMGVFASSLKASFGDVISDRTNADLFVTASSAQAPGFSPSVVARSGPCRGWTRSRPTAGARPGSRRRPRAYSAVDPATAEGVMNLDVSQGSLADLGKDGVVVSTSAARSHGWKVGDTVPAEFAETGKQRLQVVGTYDGKGWISDDYIISLAAQNPSPAPPVTAGLVTVADGADPGEVQAAVDDALATHPDARVLDQEGYEEVAGGFIDQLLTFVTVMLLLAVVIALLGIVNTLALSVFERTRELGLLRAVGMTRNQVRAMVRWESAVISLIGAVSGAVLGIGIGLALSQALKDQGIKAISIPVTQLALYVALAAVAGVLAAIGPSRSAAKVDVLKAVVTD